MINDCFENLITKIIRNEIFINLFFMTDEQIDLIVRSIEYAEIHYGGG